MKILISSRSEEALKNIESGIAGDARYQIEGILMINGARDPLRVVDYRPDVLIMLAIVHLVEELQSLAARPGRDRPAIIVVGNQLPADATRHAMRAGARDFIPEQEAAELVESLNRLSSELYAETNDVSGKAIVVVNAKGGSGGTFVATNLAQLSVTLGGEETAIVDLDFQYAPLPHYFDVKPKRGLLEALANADELDETAVGAYAVKHEAGLQIFAPIPDAQSAVDFNLGDRMMHMLEILKSRYDKVVIDMPRHLDEVSSRVLQSADEVLLVMQPSLLAVHDAVRLKTVLINELEIPDERITIVLNRYTRNSSLDADDVSSALDEEDLVLIPNQYKLVAESLDMGEPVVEHAPTSAVAKALVGLQGRVMGQRPRENKSFLAKTVMRLRG